MKIKSSLQRAKAKSPFVSADDVAAVAFRALTDEVAHNTDHLLLGPELLSYDDVSYSLFISIFLRLLSLTFF
jgi:uncharacterized protein YbjT (DUF2867 family)